MRKSTRLPQGFTLVEIAAALVIFGLVTGISFGALNTSLRTSRLTGSSRILIGDLYSARQKAIAEGNNYVVTFDLVQRRYRIWDDDGSDGYQAPGEAERTVPFPVNVSVQSVSFGGSNRVTYRPDGSCASGGYVVLQNEQGIRARVTVVRATGRVRSSFLH